MATNYTTEVNGQASINIGTSQIYAPYGTFTTIANQIVPVQNVYVILIPSPYFTYIKHHSSPKLELVVTGKQVTLITRYLY